MRLARACAVLAAATVLPAAAADPPTAAIPYFAELRDVVVERPGQSYVVVDAAMWRRVRADLADLRLYAANRTEVPYAIRREARELRITEIPARLLNLSRTSAGTQFVLQLSQPGEYDRIGLDLTTRDFVGRVRVEGAQDRGRWARVGELPVYDFSRERLGRNFELRLPASDFRLLRLTLPPEVELGAVRGAKVLHAQERGGSWTPLETEPQPRNEGRDTVAVWEQPEHAPLDRVAVEVGGGGNFRRPVEIKDAEGRIIARGEIARFKVALARSGSNETLGTEKLDVELEGARSKRFTLVVHNGDDPPLPITRVQPASVERRVYFEARETAALQLHYGDAEAPAPVYDYARIFEPQADAARAQLGPARPNPSYTGRPDLRPWSERHPALLWTALILAVAGLGAVALRGLMRRPPTAD
jgi:hypothetical protein